MDHEPTPAEVERLLEQLRRGLRQRRRWGWALGCGLALLLVAPCLAGMVEVALREAYEVGGIAVETQAGRWTLAGLAVCVVLWVPRALASARAREAARRLAAAQDDVRLVPALLEAAEAGDGRTRAAACVVLARLLPQMGLADAVMLEPRHREMLRNVLQTRNPGLVLAALAGLERFGRRADEWYIEGLAGAAPQSVSFPLSGRPDVRAGAARCLASLQERLEREHQRDVLLRPSDSPAAHPQSLLRPAQPGGDSDPSALLRPADGPDRPADEGGGA